MSERERGGMFTGEGKTKGFLQPQDGGVFKGVRRNEGLSVGGGGVRDSKRERESNSQRTLLHQPP